MAPIFQFKCSKCNYHLPGGLDGEFYVENAQLERISTGEVIDEEKIMAVTGMEYWDAYNSGLTGFISYCYCLECMNQMNIDIERDNKVCSKCQSLNVVSRRGMPGSLCPSCNKGKMLGEMIAVT